MRALKTIVATAVIMFALTTVAMAGVEHFTKQSGQTAGAQAQQAQPTYSVTLTAAQLKQMIGAQGNGATKATANAQRTQQQHTVRVRETTQSTTRNDDRAQTSSSSGSRYDGNGTCSPNNYDYDHHYDHAGSGDGEHHSGDGGEGCR